MKIALDEYHWHEAFDRTACAIDAFERNVVEHPAVRQTPDLARKAESAFAALELLHQAIGRIHFKDAP